MEDVGIALGQALNEALGDRKGITRYASIDLAMDELTDDLILELFEMTDEQGRVHMRLNLHGKDRRFTALSRRYRMKMDDITKKKLIDLGLRFHFN